jgi:hypothetical protein
MSKSEVKKDLGRVLKSKTLKKLFPQLVKRGLGE